MIKIKNRTLRFLVVTQSATFLLFFLMTLSNELLDIPYYLFGDQPTTLGQRTGEMVMELIFALIIIAIEFVVIKILYRRVRILEGFLPICANCKKIRHGNNWEQIEKYISEHSLAEFSHSICPECVKTLYPEICHNQPRITAYGGG